MGEWDLGRFEDLMAISTRNGIHKSVEYQGSGTPVVKMGEVYSSMYVDDGDDRDLLDLSLSELSKLSIQVDDLLFCRTSLVADGVGRCAIVRNLSKTTSFASNLIRVRLDKKFGDPRFYHFVFRSPLGLNLMRSIVRGTSVSTITGPDISNLLVPIPPLAEQRAIAGVLGALDDKIESNRRLTATIDGLLRAELENAVVGDESTREISMGDVAVRVSDGVDPRALSQHVAYIGLEHMPRGLMFLDKWGTSEGLGSGKSAFAKGDVLFGRLRPYFKKVGIAPLDGVCSTDVLVLRPAAGESLAVLLALVASEEFIAYASAAATGTKMPRVSWEYLAAWKTSLPSLEATARLDEQLRPVVEQAVASIHERHTLSKLRDALLPELLSGRLRVKDAESMMEDL